MEQRSRGIAALVRPIVFNCNGPEPQRNTVRTTLAIDKDLLGFATSMAMARGVSIGRAVSDLMRWGMESDGITRSNDRGPHSGVSEDWSVASRAGASR